MSPTSASTAPSPSGALRESSTASKTWSGIFRSAESVIRNDYYSICKSFSIVSVSIKYNMLTKKNQWVDENSCTNANWRSFDVVFRQIFVIASNRKKKNVKNQNIDLYH